MPLDPQAKIILEENVALGLPAYNQLSPAEARKQMLKLSPPVDPLLAANRVEDRKITGPDSEVPVRLYYPEGDPPFPILVYFHGGGWVIGNLETHHAVCHALSKVSGCLVVAVDYRLAPEHPYPAQVEDAYAAICWVAENAEAIQADSGRIAVGGDSAGGTQATVVTMMVRDRGGPQIALQVLIYPITDCVFETPSYLKNAEGCMLTRDLMMWFWEHYIQDKKLAEHPYVSPLRAKDLSNLPEALILTAEYDPLLDEGEAYAGKLQQAGVKTKLTRYDGMIHGFFRMTSHLDKAREALDEVAGSLRRILKVN
ncbi:MAG: alpha/beta hydrolase [Desulfobacterales bacterium]|nr:MAG: alpha/beta hydrolase [Desulfobacterales bacterium]